MASRKSSGTEFNGDIMTDNLYRKSKHVPQPAVTKPTHTENLSAALENAKRHQAHIEMQAHSQRKFDSPNIEIAQEYLLTQDQQIRQGAAIISILTGIMRAITGTEYDFEETVQVASEFIRTGELPK
jgi:hypothetical protein